VKMSIPKRPNLFYLMILQFSPDDSERVVDEMVVDVNLGQAVGGARRDPLLVGVVVNHDRRARRRYALFRPFVTESKETNVRTLDGTDVV